MEKNLQALGAGFETENGPFGSSERELLQNSIDQWIAANRLPDAGFDLAVCAWQEIGESYGDPQILAASCSIAEESSEADLEEFQAQKEAIRTIMTVYAMSVQNESDIYSARMRDAYRSQPLVLMLNAEGGRFMVSLATWYNYVAIGKTLRFLEFVGNLLCQMRINDEVLARSFARAFGMARIYPQGQGQTPLFSPALPDAGDVKAKRFPQN